jgi:hypothetical protein
MVGHDFDGYAGVRQTVRKRLDGGIDMKKAVIFGAGILGRILYQKEGNKEES